VAKSINISSSKKFHVV